MNQLPQNQQKNEMNPVLKAFVIVAVVFFAIIFLDIKNIKSNNNTNSSGQYRENTTEAKTPETSVKDSVPNGTRNNPLLIGQTGDFDGYTFYKYATQVTVIEVTRGNEANDLVENASIWNADPDDGEEWVLVKVKIKAIDTKGNGAASVSNYNFDFVRQDGSTYENNGIIGLKPELTDIYEGGTTEGYIGCISKIGEKLLLSYQDGNLWFSLETVSQETSERPTESFSSDSNSENFDAISTADVMDVIPM